MVCGHQGQQAAVRIRSASPLVRRLVTRWFKGDGTHTHTQDDRWMTDGWMGDGLLPRVQGGAWKGACTEVVNGRQDPSPGCRDSRKKHCWTWGLWLWRNTDLAVA
mmetsp:Transcript_43105/g.92962  ORF Transcript_43105/g.92962 Transcript_43105/m.92962 type:complete len:105 (-) Transcript_43105:267-581(-)